MSTTDEQHPEPTMPSPISITMTIDKPIYSLSDPKEPSLQFTTTSTINQPITLYIKGTILDPDSSNVWKKSARDQLFHAFETTTNHNVSFPTEIRCGGPSYIQPDNFLTISPGTTSTTTQQFYILSNWTRKEPEKDWTLTSARTGETKIRYFKPGHTYRIGLTNRPKPPVKGEPYKPDEKADYQINLRWWYGMKEELLASVGQHTKLTDLPEPMSYVRIDGVPDVEVMVEP